MSDRALERIRVASWWAIAVGAWMVFVANAKPADIGTGSPPRPPVAAKVAPKPQPVRVPNKLPSKAPGYHEHRCAACGTVWGHGAASYGNRAAHTCPKCGRVQWQRADGRSDDIQTINCPT